ncbi:MAG: transposase, partial [Lachnospirales bacterium]
YYKKEKVAGRSKKELEILLKVYLIRQFFGLSYERCEDEIHESISAIDAPKSTKNKDKSRDKEAGWTKKGGNYRHGFKAHTGVDEKTGLIHSKEPDKQGWHSHFSCSEKFRVKFTATNVHDLHAVEDCLHGEETEFYGDSGYLGVDNHSKKVKNCKKNIMKRRTSLKKLSAE